MVLPYHYVRFRWWGTIDLNLALKKFSGFKSKKIVEEKGGSRSQSTRTSGKRLR